MTDTDTAQTIKLTGLTGFQAQVVTEFPGLVEATATTATFEVGTDWVRQATEVVEAAKDRMVRQAAEAGYRRSRSAPHYDAIVRKVRKAAQA